MAKKQSRDDVDHAFDPVTIGTDEAAEGGVSIIRSETGRVAFVPRSVERLAGEALEIAGEMQEVVVSIREGQQALDGLVFEGRESGMSWAAIGWCVGTSGEAARQRWGRDD